MSEIKTAYILLNQSGGSPLPNGTTGGQYLDSSWPDRWEGGVPSDLAGAQLYGLKIVDGYVERESQNGDDFISVVLQVHQWVNGSLNTNDLLTGNNPYYPDLPVGTGRVDLPARNTGTTSLSGPREWDYADGWTPAISLWENDVAGESQRFSYFQFGTGAEPEKALRLYVATASYNNNMGGDNDRPWFSPIRIEVKYIPVGPSGPSGSGTPQAQPAEVVGNAFIGVVPDVTGSGALDSEPALVSGEATTTVVVSGDGVLTPVYPLTVKNYFKTSPLVWDYPANQDAPLLYTGSGNPVKSEPDEYFWQWVDYEIPSAGDRQNFYWLTRTTPTYTDGNLNPDSFVDVQYQTTLRTRVTNYGDTIKFGFLYLGQSSPYLNSYEPAWNWFKFHLKDEAGTILTTFFDTGSLWDWVLAQDDGYALPPLTRRAEGVALRKTGWDTDPEIAKQTVDFEIAKPDLSLYPTAKYIDWEWSVGRRAVTAEIISGDYEWPACNLKLLDPYVRETYQGPVLGYDADWAVGNVADVLGSGECQASEQMVWFPIDEKDYGLHINVYSDTGAFNGWEGPLLKRLSIFDTGYPDYESRDDVGYKAYGNEGIFNPIAFGQKAYRWRWRTDDTGDTENTGWLVSDSGTKKGEPFHVDSAQEDVTGQERNGFRTEFYVLTRSASNVPDFSRPEVYIDLPVTTTPGDGNLSPGDLITWDTEWGYYLFSEGGFKSALECVTRSWVIDDFGGNELSLFHQGEPIRILKTAYEQFRPATGVDFGTYGERLNTKFHGRVPEGATWVRIGQECYGDYLSSNNRFERIDFWCQSNYARSMLDPDSETDPKNSVTAFPSYDGLIRRMESPILPASPGDDRMAPVNTGSPLFRDFNKQLALTIGAYTPSDSSYRGMGIAEINPAIGLVADGVLITTAALITGEASLVWFATGSVQATLATVSGSASFILSAFGAAVASLVKVWSVGSAYRAKKRITQLTKAKAQRATTSGSGTVS